MQTNKPKSHNSEVIYSYRGATASYGFGATRQPQSMTSFGWPFNKLTITPEFLTISIGFKTFKIPAVNILRVEPNQLNFLRYGFYIIHDCEEVPELIQFRPIYNYEKFFEAIRKIGGEIILL